MKLRVAAILALTISLATIFSHRAQAAEAADHDAFFLAAGSANVTVKESNALLSGSAIWGGFRIGLLSFVFVELGYGTVGYSDTVDVAGSVKRIEFRTTGANYGLGIVVPIRKLRMGARFQRHPNNRWAEEVTDQTTGTTESNISGDIDYDSVSVFGQFFAGKLEAGVRRDIIRDTDSQLENSFGVYLMWNIQLK